MFILIYRIYLITIKAPLEIGAFLEGNVELEDTPASFTHFDWRLQCLFTQRARNPIFQLLLDSFEEMNSLMGEICLSTEASREHSWAYYTTLQNCLDDPAATETLTL